MFIKHVKFTDLQIFSKLDQFNENHHRVLSYTIQIIQMFSYYNL